MTDSPLAAVQSAWSAAIGSFGATAGVGIDLVEMSAFKSLIETGGDSFIDSVWSPREQRDAGASPARLAARWAAKEAVMKALQHGLGDLEPLDIEVLTEAGGSPSVALHGNAATIASTLGVGGWHISLCHEEGWAAAIAVADRDPTPTGTTRSQERNPDD